ncbi:unnamed protein product, partial [Mesorhabditis belari]|uniref:Skp1-related protein n=1 Tax=Mesorhabditis belari TaxID=2138241 RepID=A0AAF3EUP0_9BILA
MVGAKTLWERSGFFYGISCALWCFVQNSAKMTGSDVFIKLMTNDGKILEISKQAADRSGTLLELLRNCPIDDVKNMDPIVLTEVDETIAKMVIKWCEDHKDLPILTDDKSITLEEIKNMEKELLQDLDGNQLCDLYQASNWMDVRCLRKMISKILATMIAGKKYTEIRTLWQLKGDFTAKEEARLRKVDSFKYLTDLITKHEEATENVAANPRRIQICRCQ